MAKKKKRHIKVTNPVFTVVFEEDEDIFFKTNSVLKATEFVQDREQVKMKATNSRTGENISTDVIKKFTINFNTGRWSVSTDDTVYKITTA